MSTSLMNLNHENAFRLTDLRSCPSDICISRSYFWVYSRALDLQIVLPLDFKVIACEEFDKSFCGGSLTGLSVQASSLALMPSSCGMLVYRDVTSIETGVIGHDS